MAQSTPNPGPFCAEFGITTTMLLDQTAALSLPSVPVIKNGLVLELFAVLKSNKLTWATFSSWIEKLYSGGTKPDIWALRKSVIAISTRHANLKKTPKRKPEAERLLNTPYTTPTQQSSGSSTEAKLPAAPSRFQTETTILVNKSLAVEVAEWKQKHEELLQESMKMTQKIEKLKQLVETYKPHNVRRREKRKDKKIRCQLDKIDKLERQLKYKTSAFLKNTKGQIQYYKDKCEQLKEKMVAALSECENCEQLANETSKTKQTNVELMEANAELHDEVKHLQSKMLTTFEDGKYTNELRVCVMDLLSHNVAILQIVPVIQSVLKLAGVTCNRLPKHTAINDMLIEARALSQMQLAEVLTQEDHHTLHSDGTTKFGHKYLAYQVSTEHETYTLGMREVASGSAQSMLEKMKEILDDLSVSASTSDDKNTQVASEIVARIKSTMSDRASTEKSFNALLADYRAEVLPLVVKNWEELSQKEKETMSEMYNFFGGIHFVVSMAETTSEAIHLFEKAHHEDVSENTEAGTIRLIRTACKAFERRGDEKSGCAVQFHTYLRRLGITNVHLAHFRGNRFNIVFLNGARVFYLHRHMIEFLTKVWGPQNKLLKAVLDDANNELYISGCRALGLIDKLITAPLWRILESDLHISTYFTKLLEFLAECGDDASEFLTGEKVPFPDTPVNKDDVWASLVVPSPSDPLVQQILQALFKSLELLAQRMLVDHLPGGKWEGASGSVRNQTKSVTKTNTVSERDFAKLDRLLREKPNASLLALEAHILFSTNKTSKWLAQQAIHKQESLLASGRRLAPAHRAQFRERLAVIEQQRRELLQTKQDNIRKKEQKVLQEKEKLTSEIVSIGLWQTKDDVEQQLLRIKSETKKKEALKIQLKFRKNVLHQNSDAAIYRFSKKGVGQFSSTILKENLLKLIEDAWKAPPVSTSQSATSADPILVGKRIQHKFSENKEIVAYTGTVVSQVPGFPEWYNVVYEDEPDIVYTYKLMEDYANGDLSIIVG